MKQFKWNVYLTELEIKDLFNRCHYSDTDFNDFLNIYRECLVRQDVIFFYQEDYNQSASKCNENTKLVVLATLGVGIDSFQEEISKEGRLLEALMVEHVAMRLLEKGYEQFGEFIFEINQKQIYHFQFGGSDLSFEEQKEYFNSFHQNIIRMKSSFMFQPLKSVLFKVTLKEADTYNPCSICLNCKNPCEYFKLD